MINNKTVFAKGDMTGRNFVSALRRDAAFIGNVLISAVFGAFATLAVASAVLDLVAIRH